MPASPTARRLVSLHAARTLSTLTAALLAGALLAFAGCSPRPGQQEMPSVPGTAERTNTPSTTPVPEVGGTRPADPTSPTNSPTTSPTTPMTPSTSTAPADIPASAVAR